MGNEPGQGPERSDTGLMYLFADILTLSVLAFLIYQDFRFRHISWWTLPVIFFAQWFIAAFFIGFKQSVSNTFFNLLFLAVQYIFLYIYFSVKNKKITGITDRYIGMGDILFFIAATVSFSFIHFILYYFLCLFIALIGFGLPVIMMRRKTTQTIPLAGISGLIFGAAIIGRMISPEVNFYDDSFFLDVINNWKI